MKNCGQSTPLQQPNDFQKQVEKLERDFRRAKEDLAIRNAKFLVGQTIKHNNWPDSRYKTGVVESIGLDYLDEWKIVYYVDYPNGRCGLVYEEEIVGKPH